MTLYTPASDLPSRPTLQTLLGHRSVRKYLNKPIAADTLEAVLNAGRAVSSSSYLQAVSVIRVQDPKKRAAFRQISNNLSAEKYDALVAQGKRLGHAYVEECAEFLVFCMDAYRHAQLAPDAQLDWTEVALIGAIDTALFAQNVLAAAESLGLGGVFIGSLRNDMQRASDLLGLPMRVAPLFGLCLGHPDWDAKVNQTQRPRLPLSVLVSEETYQEPNAEALQAYNEAVAAYYGDRGVKMDWIDQIAATFGKEVRPAMLAYLQAQGFARR